MIGAIAGNIIGSNWNNKPEKSFHHPLFMKNMVISKTTMSALAIANAVKDGVDYKKSIIEFAQIHQSILCKVNEEVTIQLNEIYLDWLINGTDNLPIMPYIRSGSESALRVAAIGWAFDDEQDVLEQAEISSHATHDHRKAVDAAKAVALSIHMARHGASKEDICERMVLVFNYVIIENLKLLHEHYNFAFDAIHLVPHAFSCLMNSSYYEESVRNALYIGGNCGAIACIVGSISEALWGVSEDISDIAYGHISSYSEKLLTDLNDFEALYGKNSMRSILNNHQRQGACLPLF